eukprot:scpid73486/ scgid8115/ 
MHRLTINALVLLIITLAVLGRKDDHVVSPPDGIRHHGEGHVNAATMVSSTETRPSTPHRRSRRGLASRIFQRLKAVGRKLHSGGKAAWRTFVKGLKKGGAGVLTAMASKTGRKIATGLKHASTVVSLVCCTVGSIAFPVAGVPCCAAIKIVKRVIGHVSKAQSIAAGVQRNCRPNRRSSSRRRDVLQSYERSWGPKSHASELASAGLRQGVPDMPFLSDKDVTSLQRDVIVVHTTLRACGGYGDRRDVIMERTIKSTLSTLSKSGGSSSISSHSIKAARMLLPQRKARTLTTRSRYEANPANMFRSAYLTRTCWRTEVVLANRLRQRLADHVIQLWRALFRSDMPDSVARAMKEGLIK